MQLHQWENHPTSFCGKWFFFPTAQRTNYTVQILIFIFFLPRNCSQGDRRIHFDGAIFCVRNGGYSAGFDEKNQVTIFNKKLYPNI